MAAPTYTTDLTTLTQAEEDPANTVWFELTGTIGGEDYDANGGPVGGDPDYPYIQGSYSVTQDCTKDSSVGSLTYNNASGTGGHGTDGAYLVWQNYMVASNIGTYAQGGLQICVGSGLGDFDAWYVGGVDKAPYPYGGWVNNAANTTVTPDGTAGSPTTTEQYIGSAIYVVQGSSKGEVHNCDAIRYGRGSAKFLLGDSSNGYATIPGFATQNDNNSNRWGLIQETSGGYLWKGRMQFGSAATAVNFRDSNQNIFVQWTPKVTDKFNLIEVLNTDSYVSMDGFSFQVLDTTTASPGHFKMSATATVLTNYCSFIDMGRFDFDANGGTVVHTGTTWQRCDMITQEGATFEACSILNSTAATASFFADDIDLIDNCTFTMAATCHAIELSSDHAGNSYTLVNVTFNNYATADGSDGDEAIFNNSGGAVTITISGGTTPYVRNGSGASTNIVANAVTVKVIVQTATGTKIQNANVFLATANGTGPFPYQDSVSIINSGTLATVTHSTHGLATNDKIWIRNASLAANNGVFSIAATHSDRYSYTMGSSPGSSPTGADATYVILKGLTDVNGEISTSKSFSANQDFTGWARKSSSAPLYKTGPVSGEVDKDVNTTFTAILSLDQ